MPGPCVENMAELEHFRRPLRPAQPRHQLAQYPEDEPREAQQNEHPGDDIHHHNAHDTEESAAVQVLDVAVERTAARCALRGREGERLELGVGSLGLHEPVAADNAQCIALGAQIRGAQLARLQLLPSARPRGQNGDGVSVQSHQVPARHDDRAAHRLPLRQPRHGLRIRRVVIRAAEQTGRTVQVQLIPAAQGAAHQPIAPVLRPIGRG